MTWRPSYRRPGFGENSAIALPEHGLTERSEHGFEAELSRIVEGASFAGSAGSSYWRVSISTHDDVRDVRKGT